MYEHANKYLKVFFRLFLTQRPDFRSRIRKLGRSAQ